MRTHSSHPRKTPAKLAPDALYDYAVRALADRASSVDELRFKLRRRAARIEDIEPVIHRLLELGYLNDQRFAGMFATIKVENEGFGRARVLHDLRARRIAPKMAEEAVSQVFGDKDEQEMLNAFIERRMPLIVAGGHAGDDRRLAAAYRKLRRAGFSSGAVLNALRRFASHPELFDEPPPEDDPGHA